MGMPSGIGIVDTMIGFPQEGAHDAQAIYDDMRVLFYCNVTVEPL